MTRPQTEPIVDYLAAFSDPSTWTPRQASLMELPVKVALESHFLFLNHLDHPSAAECKCPLAEWLRKHMRGGA